MPCATDVGGECIGSFLPCQCFFSKMYAAPQQCTVEEKRFSSLINNRLTAADAPHHRVAISREWPCRTAERGIAAIAANSLAEVT